MQNRFGGPEMVMRFEDGSTMTVTQAEAYCDAVLQRIGFTGKDLGDPSGLQQHEKFMAETVVPAIFAVLYDAGEITLVEGRKFEPEGPEMSKMLVVATGVGSILGFNRAANKHFGEGKWQL